MKTHVSFEKRREGPLRAVSGSVFAAAIVAGLFCSSDAQAVDPFFDVFVELSNNGQVEMVPVDSGAFPFPPPPLNFPDIETAAPGSQTVDIELVSLSLRSSSRMPMRVGELDPTTNSFQVDSFFDIDYELNATDSTGIPTHTVDSFFDVEVSMLVTPQDPMTLPTGGESRTFETEMVALSLTGSNPVDLSGDPDFDLAIQLIEGQASKADGHVTVLKSPGGGFTVDSFFDVFVEVSVDGGPLASSKENSQLRLESRTVVPEPSTLLLSVMAGMGLLMWRRTRRV